MKWKIVPFERLTTTDLYALLRLRAAVFIVEQNCVYQDIDNQDQIAYHLIGKTKEENICAYARIFPPKNGYVSIGRVVVEAKERNRDYGKNVMVKALKFSQQKFNGFPIKISAQKHLESFYSSLGFEYRGEDYLEDNIPHCAMYYSFE